MKAPDKIYLNTSDGDYEFAEWNVVPYAEVTTEYISKDALLEWAEKKIAKGMIDEWDKGYVQCLKDLIDKLNNF